MKPKKTKSDSTGVNIRKLTLLISSFLLAFGLLMYYKLGSLIHGLSQTEIAASTQAVGWHGIYHSPDFLPLKILRSIDFKLFHHHGQFLTRFPNTILGFISAACFGALIYMWHGQRTAVLATLMFCCSAWVLHASRLASFDVMYLFGITSLLLVHQLLYKFDENLFVWLLNFFLWGLLLTIPGFIWIVLVDIFFQREILADGWRYFELWWHRALSVVLLIIWLPLIGLYVKHVAGLKVWLGLPTKFPGVLNLVKQFLAVFYHLFIRGPLYPNLWLGRSPALDVFTLALAIIGIYFYGTKLSSSRSRLLALMFIVSVILVSLGGPVSFVLLIPLMYVMAAMGLSYMIHNWLKVFPRNPIARYFGIGLISLAVIFSCVYNLRAYFVAWPNNPDAVSTFSHRL
jgi:hypothetical protein